MGPLTGSASGHGGLSPWLVHNTLILWGPDFKRGVTVRAAAGNVDITPTVLHIKGDINAEWLGGRPLKEALRDGPDEEQVPSETRLLRTEVKGVYRATIQVTDVGGRRYIDKAWRMR
jgi:arylsulfatase A-like enzyme